MYLNVRYANRTLHDATREEKSVLCEDLRHDATRQDKNRALSQVSNIVRSLSTSPDFCLVVSQTPAHYTIFSWGVVVSRRVMCGGHYSYKVCLVEVLFTFSLNIFSSIPKNIIGRSEFKLDISAVFCGRTHLSYSFIVLAMGLSSDFVYDAEEHRTCQCIGGLRYMFPFFKNLFTRRPLKLEIDYKKYEETEQ